MKGGQQGQYIQSGSQYAVQSGARSNVRRLPSRPRPSARQQEGQYDDGQYRAAHDASAEPPVYGSVAGTPGQDFPAYSQVPQTSFSCQGVPYEPGMYADEETQCQAYHVCFDGRKESFLCGVGTVFNQAILTCDYWHAVDCGRSREFYSANEELGKAGAEPGQGGAQSVVKQATRLSQKQPRPQQQQPRPQPRPAKFQQQRPQQYQQTGYSQGQYPQEQYQPASYQTGRQYKPAGSQARAFSAAQASVGQQQPQYRPQQARPQVIEYEAQEISCYEGQQCQPQGPQPGRKAFRKPTPFQGQPKPAGQQFTSVQAKVQYGGQAIQVDSVVGASEGTEYAQEDQAAVLAGYPSGQPQRPRPQARAYAGAQSAPQKPYRPQQAQKSKYRAPAVGQQLSPSYRSKALSQSQSHGSYQDNFDEQPHEQQPFSQPSDTQQKLSYAAAA